MATQEAKIQSPTVDTSGMEKSQLLLLGLNLLKGLNIPCAVVQPQVKAASDTSTMSSAPNSPSKEPVLSLVTSEGSRKRKRDQSDIINEVEKREKR